MLGFAKPQVRLAGAMPFKCAAIVALLLFILLDCSLRIVSGPCIDDALSQSDAAQLIEAYKSEKSTESTFMFLGSSLVREALRGSSPDFLAGVFADAKNCRVASLGISGQDISDACLFAPRLIDSGKQPQLILWGVSPSQFVNNEMPNLTATASVKYCRRLGYLASAEYFDSLPQVLDYSFPCLCYLADYYFDFVHLNAQGSKVFRNSLRDKLVQLGPNLVALKQRKVL